MKKKQLQSGFALIYALIFTAMILTLLTTIVAVIASNYNLNRASDASVAAAALGKSGIEMGWYDYRVSVGAGNDLGKNLPDNACDTSPGFLRYQANSDFEATPKGMPTKVSAPNADDLTALYRDNSLGFFDYRVCGTSNLIESIGYYGNKKVILRATIYHNNDEITSQYYSRTPVGIYYMPAGELYGPDSYYEIELQDPEGGLCTGASSTKLCITDKYDHSQDKIKIIQETP